jgi:hypothetical protein
MKKYFYFILMVSFFQSCTSTSQKDIDLGPLPGKPEFSVEYVPGDSNKVIITDLSQGNFIRLWNIEGGQPATSTLTSDTIVFSKKAIITLLYTFRNQEAMVLLLIQNRFILPTT